MRLGYPPAIVFKNEHTKYLDAMRKANKGDYGPTWLSSKKWLADYQKNKHKRTGKVAKPGS